MRQEMGRGTETETELVNWVQMQKKGVLLCCETLTRERHGIAGCLWH